MLKSIVNGPKAQPAPQWRKTLARIRQPRSTDVEPEEQRSLEAMLHWRDPVDRLRMLRRQRHTLVDDNPASG